MEIGSGGGCCGGGGGGGGDDQHLHGLQFGKKIYFEDATTPPATGTATTSVNASSSSSSSSSKAGRKGKALAVPAPPAPPRCQVEGCDVDLSGWKTYYCRHKVCHPHARAHHVVVNGIEQRFCQQCSRFHQLTEFDQEKRSCRRRLAGHNERRRKPPPGPIPSRFTRLAASFEEPGRYRSFLLDFSYPRVPSSVRDAWPAVRPGYRMPSEIQWQGNLDLRPHAGYGPHAYGSHGFPGPELPPGGSLTGVAADSSCALSLLSTQPWDTTTHGASHDHRSAAMSAAAGFDGNPVAAVSPSIMASNYMPPPGSPWGGSRVHEGGRNVLHQQLPHNVQLHEVHPAGSSQHGHFSGELELALQGNRQAPGPHADHDGGGNTFDHPGSSSNWSL